MRDNDDDLKNDLGCGEMPPIGYGADGVSELPAIIGAPTARSKLLELEQELNAYASAYTKGSHNTDDPHELTAIEHGRALIALLKPMLGRAYELGIDEAIFPTTLRFCPDCPKSHRKPLAKRKRYCPEHGARRRRITYRLSKRNKRKKMSTVSTVHSKCNKDMNDQAKKQKIIALMGKEGLSLRNATERVGVSTRQATDWYLYDNEFYRAVTASRLASYLGFILKADDLVRSGKELNEGQKLYVENAIWLRDYIAYVFPDEVGFVSPEFAERGRKHRESGYE